MFLAELFPYAHQVYIFLTVLYFLTVLGIIAVVVSENRNPVKSLAWVTVLLLLPIIGIVLYLFFGRSMKSVHMISRKNRLKLRSNQQFASSDPASLLLDDESRQLAALINRLTEPHFFQTNEVEIFTSGAEKFERLKADIKAAKHYIHLQYYIFEQDTIGREMRDLLVERARAGVKVRVIYDHVGSFHLNMRFFKKMRREGVEVYPFLKVTFPEFASRVNWRNHRKIIVIDGEVGYIGGMNIADRYVTGSKKQLPWRDTHLRIKGGALAAMQYTFAVDWNFMRRELLTETVTDDVPAEGDAMQIVSGGPTGLWSNMALVLLHAITNAKSRVFIQTPYFLPNDSLLKALQMAALAHVDVRLMMPRRPDTKLLRYASYSYVKECLLAGIKVYFYEPTMLHAKSVIIDDEVVTTGSTNFDFRSFEHNFECNAVVYGKAFNERMTHIFLQDQKQCTRITLPHWRRRHIAQRALESTVRLFSPIL